MASKVQVVHEVQKNNFSHGGVLCFQWCRYVHDNGTLEEGYRFIWRNSEGKMLAHRGQARIPSIEVALKLIQEAKNEGWGNNISQADFKIF